MLLLLLFSIACSVFNFCSSNFLFFVFDGRRKGNMSLLDSVVPLRFWWSNGTVQ